MSNKSIGLSDELQDYILGHSVTEPEILRALRAETADMEFHMMQIAPEQGLFMVQLARIMGAKRVLEIGTFTGYSALIIALSLPKDGKIVTLDLSKEYTDVARRYWQSAGVLDKINLHLGPALETLETHETLGSNGGALGPDQDGTFDMAFIDADKENYLGYYEHSLRLVRPGGVILVDNVLWDGRVVDPADTAETTTAIRALNKHIRNDRRVEVVITPIGDGLSIVRKI